MDNSSAAATWVFVRQWIQQGKLVGCGAVGQAAQGASVALSAEGSTPLVGAPGDNVCIGAGVDIYAQRRVLLKFLADASFFARA